jgi:branched-chain amino acid aminotransferase
MEVLTRIKTTKTKSSRLPEVNWSNLQFGDVISDHMFVCVYENRKWGQPQIVPFGDLTLSPATLALHYGQSIFEGMKAFYTDNGSINIFRTEHHFKRLNHSLQRMCMPEVPRELFMDGLHQLIALDKEWVPKAEGSSLYIRPLVFASEARFGVKVAEKYHFIIFSGPVPPLFAQPIKVKIERSYTRAAKGGTGNAKCAGNYGGAFYPTQLAREEGYDQILWTDAVENEYIEESGMMNAMFVIAGNLVTPPLSDSILDGITRDSLLDIARSIGISVQERKVSATEIKNAFGNGTITEAFGAGTAAVVAPIGSIGIDGVDYKLPAYDNNSIMFHLKNEMDAIRCGRKPDIYNWNDLL